MPAAIALTATLTEDARHVRTRDGGSRLVLTLAMPLPQPAAGRQAVARVVHEAGQGESAAYATHARALRLRRGSRVHVQADSAEAVRGRWVLHEVTRIDEPDLTLRNVTGDSD